MAARSGSEQEHGAAAPAGALSSLLWWLVTSPLALVLLFFNVTLAASASGVPPLVAFGRASGRASR